MILRQPAALHINMTTARGGYPSSLMGTIAYIRQSFLDADRYGAWQTAYAKAPKGMKRPEFDPFLETLVPYIRDRKPVVFQCNNWEDIKRVLAIVDELKLNAMLTHANEAWRDAAVLKKSGIPLLVTIVVGMLLIVFTIGSVLEGLIVAAFETWLAQPVEALALPPLLHEVLSAIVLALEAGIGIAFPFILTFYILHATLEDSGYMTRAAFLADRAMHQLGLHGRAVIPLVLAFGCNVPAVMSAAALPNRRERFIAAFLASMIPCSARTVIISGIVAAFIGIPAAFSIYGIVLLIVLMTGLILARTVPGDRYGMVLEMAPLRYPAPGLVLEKSWRRIREFLVIALPLLIAGSVVLTMLDFFGVLAAFQQFAAPLSEGVLGVPAYATTALLFGILRKEMAFETLSVLAGTANLATVMSSVQLYVFALVSTLFVPCISTVAVLNRQLGARAAFGISLYTVALGLVVGAIVQFAFG
jgi:ferrous iron transport protein B